MSQDLEEGEIEEGELPEEFTEDSIADDVGVWLDTSPSTDVQVSMPDLRVLPCRM